MIMVRFGSEADHVIANPNHAKNWDEPRLNYFTPEVRKWCEENLSGRADPYSIQGYMFEFENESDIIAFKLKFFG